MRRASPWKDHVVLDSREASGKQVFPTETESSTAETGGSVGGCESGHPERRIANADKKVKWNRMMRFRVWSTPHRCQLTAGRS